MLEFAPVYPVLYRVLSTIFPHCLWQGNPHQRQIALTFDDGPHPDYSLALLDCLDQLNIPASFFWLGQCVQRYPAVARAIAAAGHEVGLHGYTHRAFPRFSANELQQSLLATQWAIAMAIGQSLDQVRQQARNVRPPNGLFLPQTLHHLRQGGYRPVMWSVVPEDWVEPGVDRVCQRILRQVHNGAIIVLHDGVYGGAAVAATVRQIVPQLRDQGYELVTVEQLYRSHRSDFDLRQ